MNENASPTLHKQFNTIHVAQVYMVTNNLYEDIIFLSPASTFPYCIHFPNTLVEEKASKRDPSFLL